MAATTQSLIVICGPTAAGKSSLALAIARRLGSMILNADSRQVYRELNIGTAKPSLAEQRQVPHGLIDLCDPTETLTLGDYQQQAQALLAQQQTAQAEGRAGVPLLVGGTGLYIKSITRGLRIPRVPPQPTLRAQLAHLGQRHNAALLQSVDPVAAGRIHPGDAVRTQRALEVFYATGRPISTQQGESPPAYPILHIGVDTLAASAAEPGGDRLRDRIARRTQAMIAAGLVGEVEALRQRYGEGLPLLRTLGYGEICQYLRGDWGLAEAQEQIVVHTRQFAKRQRTWFRAVPAIQWFDADDPDLVERVGDRIDQFLQTSLADRLRERLG